MSALNETRALEVAVDFADSHHWSARQARVLGPVGDNATVHLPEHGVVLRVCSSAQHQRAQHELDIAGWLAAEGVNVTRPYCAHPQTFHAWTVTAWVYVPELQPGTPEAMGTALRDLHRLPAPVAPALPTLRPLDRLEDYVARSGLAQQEQRFLLGRMWEIRVQLDELDFVLPQGPVHGDAHRKNLQQSRGQGPAVLLDLERVSLGPREWDVVVPAVYRRVGWYSEAEYEQFVHAYGWDIRKWHGYEVLAAARELRMVAWLSSRTSREPRLLPEAHRRIESIRDPSSCKQWTPGR